MNDGGFYGNTYKKSIDASEKVFAQCPIIKLFDVDEIELEDDE
jgi:hypothetical protein